MIKPKGEITSLKDLNQVTQSIKENAIKLENCSPYYRGHGNNDYKLISSIARFSSDTKYLGEVEKKLIDDLKSETHKENKNDYFCIPKKVTGFDKDWYWLTQAQHLGIPTRLLDWTISNEIALYFAVDSKNCKNKDGDLWVFFVPDEFNIYNQLERTSSIKPFQAEKDLFINIPTFWNEKYEINEPQRNILNQQGKFFMRNILKSLTPLEEDQQYQKYLWRFTIPASSKNKILIELGQLNYSKVTIYKTFDKKMNSIKEKLIKTYKLS